jgi:hypothetical protein
VWLRRGMRSVGSFVDRAHMRNIRIAVISIPWLVVLSAVAGGSDPTGRATLD